LTTSGAANLICEHDWTFLEGKKTRSHTLKAGHHTFPFQLHVGGHLPCSISTQTLGGASISYKLRAAVHRPGLIHNLHALLPITIVRCFASDSLEYQQSSEIENTWPGKLMYSILLPHKAWAAGDTLTALAKFVPVSKGVKVLSITSTISETVRLSLKGANRAVTPEYTRPVVVAKHEIIGGKLVCTSEFSYKHRVPPREDARGQFSPIPTQHARLGPSTESPQAGSSVDREAEGDSGQSDDIVAHINIDLPSFLTPTHTTDPVTVIHRVRWGILIANPDGHTSELRCSLNIHVLDNHVLSEARAASMPTRRLLLGIYGNPEEEGEDIQPPSYSAHVRDRVPATNRPYSVSSGTRTPSSGLQSPSIQARSDMQLPQVPGDAQLEWIASELSRHQFSNNRSRSGEWSTSGSRFTSQLPSRASSPERGSRSSGQSSPVHPHESRGIFRNPFTAITSSFTHHHRNHSHQSVPALSQPRTPDLTEAPGRRRSGTSTTQSSPVSSPPTLSSSVLGYFNEVPDYETASRGFAGGGVPPLTSMRGLPTYEEANTQSPTPVDSTTPPSPEVS